MSDLARDLALILTSAGGAVFIPKVLAAVWRTIRGVPGRQRREIDRAQAEAAAAERRADEEAQKRRIAEEHASHCRRLLFGAECVDPATIPPWPLYHRKKEPTDEDHP